MSEFSLQRSITHTFEIALGEIQFTDVSLGAIFFLTKSLNRFSHFWFKDWQRHKIVRVSDALFTHSKGKTTPRESPRTMEESCVGHWLNPQNRRNSWLRLRLSQLTALQVNAAILLSRFYCSGTLLLLTGIFIHYFTKSSRKALSKNHLY